MGRSKNRKKRRLGAINKQMLYKDPWGRRYYHEDWVETRFRMWCGDLKFWYEVERITDERFDPIFDEAEEKSRVETREKAIANGEITEDADEDAIFPRYHIPKELFEQRYAYSREVARTLEDSQIKGKRFNSKKVAYYRNRFRQRVADGKYLLYNDRHGFDPKQTLEDYARWKSNNGQEE